MCTRGHIFLLNREDGYEAYSNLMRIVGRVAWGMGYFARPDACWTDLVGDLYRLLVVVTMR